MYIEKLNIVKQLDLIAIYRTLHPTKADHILFKCTWNFIKMDHILRHNTNKFKGFKSYKIILSDCGLQNSNVRPQSQK